MVKNPPANVGDVGLTPKQGRSSGERICYPLLILGFPYGSDVVKNLPVDAGDRGSKPGLGKSPGEGNGNQLQYSCLKLSMDRGAWRATVHGVTEELDMTE